VNVFDYGLTAYVVPTVTATCGADIINNITYFVSPMFPALSRDVAACSVKIQKVDPSVSQLRLDFIHFNLVCGLVSDHEAELSSCLYWCIWWLCPCYRVSPTDGLVCAIQMCLSWVVQRLRKSNCVGKTVDSMVRRMYWGDCCVACYFKRPLVNDPVSW